MPVSEVGPNQRASHPLAKWALAACQAPTNVRPRIILVAGAAGGPIQSRLLLDSLNERHSGSISSETTRFGGHTECVFVR